MPDISVPHKKYSLTFDSFEQLLHLLLNDIGDGVFFINPDMKVIEINDRACEIFENTRKDIVGMDCCDLIEPAHRRKLTQTLRELNDFESWAGELKAVRNEGDLFPIDITVKKFTLISRTLFCWVIKDLTEYQTLKDLLHQEKSNRHEMYVTLKNLMRAFEKERSGIETGISHRIETLLLPTIEKIKRESSTDVRNTYLNLMRDQLINLTAGFSKELDGRFLRLTRTEMKICKLIQAGLASKEIAQNMNISFETVQAHRRNIRKKLGLRGRKINLYTLLLSKSFFRHS
jgi:PAS domain S-box-containing protein